MMEHNRFGTRPPCERRRRIDDHEEHGTHGHCRSGGGGGGGSRRYFGRGGVKYALLALLTEKPMHGYQMMKALEEQSGGLYIPSAGTIYPTLQMLEDRSLIIAQEHEGKKRYAITDEGRIMLSEKPATEQPCLHDRRAAGDVVASDDLYRHERIRRKLGLHYDSYSIVQQIIAAEQLSEDSNRLKPQFNQLMKDIQQQLDSFLLHHAEPDSTEAE
ncbi:hypothetical protein PAECIP111893_01985 [Paenibacillus plantiphilus]|uniref:Transcription regulator PadR N-terminal domain-containing protein n=1 Tax=Paenibacillus plantiphilus TaxID=2905650 RepID=A0ABM9C531_9BACL|nr:PadR family transcriptional regulator [Paenibacillus plantiphilus]CAH1203509.1 hypothetical protein PAECIP111893_01985 [Paenibacillus plantiphilus]